MSKKIVKPLNSKIVDVLANYGFEVYVDDGTVDDIVEYRDGESCIAIEVSKIEVTKETPFSVMSPLGNYFLVTYAIFREDEEGYYQPILTTHSEDEACDFLDEIDENETWYDYYENDVEKQNELIEDATKRDRLTPKKIIEKHYLAKTANKKEYERGNYVFDFSSEGEYVVWQSDIDGDFFSVCETSSLSRIDRFLENIENWKEVFIAEEE